jgi:hypothetical protein
MKNRSLIFVALLIVAASCSGPVKTTETDSPNNLETSTTVNTLLAKNGFIYIAEYTLNPALKRKSMDKSVFKFTMDTITVNSSTDRWGYSIRKIKENTPDNFTILAYGGNLDVGSFEEYEFKVYKQFVQTTRVANGASWFDVSQKDISFLEEEFAKDGIVFELR